MNEAADKYIRHNGDELWSFDIIIRPGCQKKKAPWQRCFEKIRKAIVQYVRLGLSYEK